jgi:hypothetical protein
VLHLLTLRLSRRVVRGVVRARHAEIHATGARTFAIPGRDREGFKAAVSRVHLPNGARRSTDLARISEGNLPPPGGRPIPPRDADAPRYGRSLQPPDRARSRNVSPLDVTPLHFTPSAVSRTPVSGLMSTTCSGGSENSVRIPGRSSLVVSAGTLDGNNLFASGRHSSISGRSRLSDTSSSLGHRRGGSGWSPPPERAQEEPSDAARGCGYQPPFRAGRGPAFFSSGGFERRKNRPPLPPGKRLWAGEARQTAEAHPGFRGGDPAEVISGVNSGLRTDHHG